MIAALGRYLATNAPHLPAALFAIIILHICTTFAAPGLTTSGAYDRLAPTLPLHEMRVLPAVAANSQPLPFLGPDARLAACRFDTREKNVVITASLPAPGWTLALYGPDGGILYAAAGEPAGRLDIAVLLVPEVEQFGGMTPEARGERTRNEPLLRVPVSRGIAVLRAPDYGLAYKAPSDAELKRAVCAPRQR